jgi:FkbM family methyltransferase
MPRVMESLREAAVRALTRRRGVARIVNGLALRVDAEGRHVFTPAYDSGATDYLRRHVPEGAEVWNVGANVGVYALQLAHWVGDGGRVVAFEPNPAARRILLRNLRLNGVSGRVDVIPAAVGGDEGSVDFFADGADGMGRAGQANPQLTRAKPIRVPVTTLDAVAATRGRLPAAVVMDVEGWEIAALRGARSLLGKTNFVVELHPEAWKWSGHSRSDLQAILDVHGLHASAVSGQSDPLGEHGQVVLLRRSS